MNQTLNWRTRGFTAGWILLALGGAALVVAGSREHHWMYEKSFIEGSIWVYGGLLVAAFSMLLLLCGKGWRRPVFEVAAFIELYLWFSWLVWAIQMR